MAFPNVTDIVATTIQKRSKKIQDNVTKNNALLSWMKERGNIREASGGDVILEEISYAENANAGWYSGYDLLPVAAQDVLSAAQFDWKQAACPVVISGLDELKNSGPERMIDLMEGRMKVAESTMENLISEGIYSDGTNYGGKQVVGLDAAVPVTNTNTYGGIDRSTWTFWKNKSTTSGVALTAATIQDAMNTMWASLVRGADRPDLILVDNFMWGLYLASLQAQQRFTSTTKKAGAGFPSLQYMDADVVLDGGIGGFATTRTMYFLNTKYLYWRPHAKRNMVPLSPNKRTAVNQDAEVQIIAFAGNMTGSGMQYQGRLISA